MNKIKKFIVKPIETFLHFEASGGILLMLVAFISFFLANSSFKDWYFNLVNLPISVSAGTLSTTHSLGFWINDALMVIFFFVVGLEIKRELISGELNTLSKAAFPAIAALFGAIVPAAVFYLLNHQTPETIQGWGIPMATDIAFAVGVLTLFGKRIPLSLKVFLLALAIVDDLIAILVIALFYTEKLNLIALSLAGGFFLLTHILKKAQVTNYLLYFIVGIGAWVTVFASGIHATIAGVVLGLMTPLVIPENEHIRPLDSLITFFHPWVAFIIMPAFAFFNAGVELNIKSIGDALTNTITIGIILGLVIGKPIGIFFSTIIASKLKIITIPKDIKNKDILAVGFLGGIGFTMSLFVGGLSYKDPSHLDSAKIGILFASLIAALLGSLTIYLATKSRSKITKLED